MLHQQEIHRELVSSIPFRVGDLVQISSKISFRGLCIAINRKGNATNALFITRYTGGVILRRIFVFNPTNSYQVIRACQKIISGSSRKSKWLHLLQSRHRTTLNKLTSLPKAN
jgi:hypothetical protein